ncbi:hypothetical protein ABZ412_10945 [Nocardia sp. NPDC005746]|uniref:hypothetical protein n=1 Tax=Nocardia sp. NPDC005746 TaxID=3157062 RepID=UPI0033CCCDBE
MPSESAGLGGVFGHLDAVTAVFYRDQAGLALRLDGAVVYLDDPRGVGRVVPGGRRMGPAGRVSGPSVVV